MITIVRAVQTAMACPSQWDAWDADGNYYYLRYRSGCGQVTQYKTENWVDAPWVKGDKNVYTSNSEFIRHVSGFQHGHPLAGLISLAEFAEHAGLALAPDVEYTGFGDHMADQLTYDGIINPGTAQNITQPWRNLPHGPGDS